jgi:C4-dicarboxylate-specific signal transduction histidine kinase
MTYFLATPHLSFEAERLEDVAALLTFLSTSLVMLCLAVVSRSKAEERLRKIRIDLERVARPTTLGELAAGIAHEVNQTLAGVVSGGNACQRWLASDPPNIEKAQQSLHRILRDANRASTVV